MSAVGTSRSARRPAGTEPVMSGNPNIHFAQVPSAGCVVTLLSATVTLPVTGSRSTWIGRSNPETSRSVSR